MAKLAGLDLYLAPDISGGKFHQIDADMAKNTLLLNRIAWRFRKHGIMGCRH